MKGSVIIDGVDINDFGMFILKGGDYDFLSFPDRKEPEQNDWHEYDGIDADLSEIYFKEKKVSPRFYITAETGDNFLRDLNAFYELVTTPGYRQLYSREFNKTFNLRYVSCPDYTHKGGLYKSGKKSGELTVEFSMDDPLQIFSGNGNLIPSLFGSFLATEDGECITTEDGYFIELDDYLKRNKTYVAINGRDLSEFGIVVTQCYNSLLPAPAVKSPLTRSLDKMTGLMAHTPKKRVFEAKKVTVDCTMISSSLTEFYYNYEALFNNVSVLGALTLTSFLGDQPCYYSAMRNFKKLRPFSSRIIVSFSLVFVLTDPGLVSYLLATENGACITTEDGSFIQI